MKLYEEILNNKLKNMIEEATLMQLQSGFRRGRSLQDHVFTIEQIILFVLFVQ